MKYAAMSLLLSGCVPGLPSLPDASSMPVLGDTPEVRGEGRTTHLERAIYIGVLEISGSDHTVVGHGAIIDGDLVIRGSYNRVTGITIRGDIELHGNKNDVTGADRRGEVRSKGMGNRY
jgi:hypothetical protein